MVIWQLEFGAIVFIVVSTQCERDSILDVLTVKNGTAGHVNASRKVHRCHLPSLALTVKDYMGLGRRKRGE